MSTHLVVASALMLMLLGAVGGWCAGWAARGEQNRGWHRGAARELAQARTQLAQALDQLDTARGQWDSEPAPPPAVVHVHLEIPSVPSPYQGWPRPPMVDARVLPASIGGPDD